MRIVLFLVELSSIIVDTHSEFLVDLSSIIVDTHSEDSPVSSRFVFYYCRYTQ